MSEQFGDKYYAHRQAKKGIQALGDLATQLRGQAITNPREGSEAGRYCAEEVNKIIQEYPTINDVVLTVSGDDVLVPRLGVARTESMLQFGVDPSQTHSRLGHFNSADGVLNSVKPSWTTVGQDTPGFDLSLFVSSKPNALKYPYGDMPYVDIQPTYHIKVPLYDTADAEVEVRELVLLRDRVNSFEDLSKSGLANSRYLRQLQSLADAFASEKAHSYTDLDDVSLLHKIGRKGKALAQDSARLADVVTKPIEKTFGSGRTLRVEARQSFVPHNNGVAYGDDISLEGRVLGVCDEVNGTSASSLLLALDDGNGVTYVPLDQIKRLSF